MEALRDLDERYELMADKLKLMSEKMKSLQEGKSP